MGRAIGVGLLVFAGGCHALLELQHVPDPTPGTADAVIGSPADGLDATLSTCTAPRTFSVGLPVMSTVRMTEAAFEDRTPSFIVFKQGANVMYSAFTGTPTTVSANASSPGLVRDGSELFLYSLTATEVEEETITGPGMFSFPMHASSLDNARPATAVAVGGVLRMVVLVPGSAEFVEFQSTIPSSSWSQVGAALQPSTIGAGGTISYPSLSDDGLVLAFVQALGTTPAGVYWVRRPDIDTSFAGYTSSGRLLSAGNPVTSPWLTAGCASLYVVDVTSQTLYRYDQ